MEERPIKRQRLTKDYSIEDTIEDSIEDTMEDSIEDTMEDTMKMIVQNKHPTNFYSGN